MPESTIPGTVVLPAWRRALGGPRVRGTVRRAPEDFVVDEFLDFAPSGAGEHVLLRVEKRDCNTGWLATQIARHADVPLRDVGYAGLKDRFAVTTQWFSVGLAGRPEPDWQALDGDGVRVLSAARHHRKLRRGAHAGNRFRLRMHDVSGDLVQLEVQLARLAAGGLPNYFGSQRFGRGAGNLAAAQRLLSGVRMRLDRQRRGIYLSAARSLLFNNVLDARIGAGSWDRAIPGDILVLDGRRSHFPCVQPDAEIERRVGALELHPSGPLWGVGERRVDGAARALEDAVLAADTAWCAGLERLRVEADRRPLRVRVGEFAWAVNGEVCELDFTLPPGSFATALLDELFTAVTKMT